MRIGPTGLCYFKHASSASTSMSTAICFWGVLPHKTRAYYTVAAQLRRKQYLSEKVKKKKKKESYPACASTSNAAVNGYKVILEMKLDLKAAELEGIAFRIAVSSPRRHKEKYHFYF